MTLARTLATTLRQVSFCKNSHVASRASSTSSASPTLELISSVQTESAVASIGSTCLFWTNQGSNPGVKYSEVTMKAKPTETVYV